VIGAKANHNTVYGGAGWGGGQRIPSPGRPPATAATTPEFVDLLGGWQGLSVVALFGVPPMRVRLLTVAPPLKGGPVFRKWD